jgi:DNA repair protein RecN (Recombination protein N)
MLLELVLTDFALIERLELRLGPGLNAITGETGAGKSLLVSALELLLGERPRGEARDWVRAGAERARIEGRFELAPGPLAERARAWLAQELPALLGEDEADEQAEVEIEGPPAKTRRAPRPAAARASAAGLELILGRSLGSDGRSRCYVNQRPVGQRSLRQLTGLLLEIHGQNDHQRLLEPAEQLQLIDALAGLESELASYEACRARWRELRERADRLEAEREQRRERLEFLRYQQGEFERLRLEPGEAQRLRAERELLRAADELGGELRRLLGELADEEGSALERLQRAARSAEVWRERVAALGEAADALNEAQAQLEEALRRLASLSAEVEADPARLELVEERLSEIEALERRHGRREDALLERARELGAQLAVFESEQEGAGELAAQVREAFGALARAAAELARARARFAPRLASTLAERLADLGLPKARIECAFRARGPGEAHATGESAEPGELDGATSPLESLLARYGPRGSETLELLFSANPGEPPRPLRHVASGGEAARVMLALRSVLVAGDRGRTLVFDEIDAGVGGRLGPRVGRHLRALAQGHQVLCVTHLPAIAAQAEVHLRVAKTVRGERATTEVERLAGEAREREVADMIAGGAQQPTARAEARRLLSEAARAAD